MILSQGWLQGQPLMGQNGTQVERVGNLIVPLKEDCHVFQVC